MNVLRVFIKSGGQGNITNMSSRVVFGKTREIARTQTGELHDPEKAHKLRSSAPVYSKKHGTGISIEG